MAVVKKTEAQTWDIYLEIELMGFASQLNVEVEETEGFRNDASVSR